MADISLASSPSGRYLVCRDPSFQNLYVYDRTTGNARNLTSSLPIPPGDAGFDEPQSIEARGLYPAAWLANDEALLIYDKYDLWRLDPTGQHPPVNLTNGYGRIHKIVLHLALGPEDRQQLAPNTTLLLTAFNTRTKESGF